MKFSELVGKKSQEFLNDYRKYADSWYFEIQELSSEFSDSMENYKELHLEDLSKRSIMRIPIKEWLCTDTYVGMYEFYTNIDNTWNFVAVSLQPSRKSATYYHWVNIYAFKYTEKLWEEWIDNSHEHGICILDLNSDVPEPFLQE